MKEEIQLLEKQAMFSDKESFNGILVKLSILEERMLGSFINGLRQCKIINKKMLDFVKSLGFKIFEKQKQCRARELEQN